MSYDNPPSYQDDPLPDPYVYDPEPVDAPPSPPPGGYDYGSTPEKKDNTVLIIVLVVVALLILCCCCGALALFGLPILDEMMYSFSILPLFLF